MKSIQVIVRMLKKAIISLSLGFVLLFCLLFIGMKGYEFATRIPFNSSDWKTGGKWELDKDELRGRMVADLISRHELKGMHRDEIIKLLGKPDGEFGFGDWDMGWITGMNMDDWLYFVIRFDSHNRVVEYDTNVG